ncbi:MAG: hypothetical protein RMH84_04005, partial [Sulfolobales archaeon]|nr:hypothetical protein [Sulfolobales archaeon]
IETVTVLGYSKTRTPRSVPILVLDLVSVDTTFRKLNPLKRASSLRGRVNFLSTYHTIDK